MSDRYPGGFIKAVPDEPTEYTAPGIWTLEQAAVYKKAGKWPLTSDPYFKETTLLLHGDGSGQELCFEDNSSNDFPITVNGDAYGTPFSPYSLDDGEWSNFFANTNTQYLTLSNSGLSISSSQDFTIEFWYNLTVINSYNCPFSSYQSSVDGLTCYVRDGTIIFYYAGDSSISGSATSVVGQWHHLAISGTSGSSIKMFHDGVQIGTTSSATISNNGTGTNFAIGRFIWGGSAYEFPGYISNFSINVGTAKYTSNFTPSTTPLAVNATNQKLLTCYSNRFIDANTATTAKTITVNGTPAVKANSPFTTTIDGTTGSGYFDGSGDTISIPDNAALDLGSSDFCIEFWFYPTSFPTYSNILNKSNSQATYASYQIWMPSSGALVFYASSTGSSYDIFNGASIGTVKLNQFNHIAVYRSGNSWYGAVNGVVSSFGTNSGTLYNNSHPLVIGGNLDAHNAFGFISNVRIVKGDPIYGASNFTPPTATLANVTGTSLLTCQYQNAVRNVGFIDSSPNNFLITRNGNATQGTFSPFSLAAGQWSAYFDGTNDYISVPDSADFTMGNGDFTIEAWLYSTRSGSTEIIWGNANSAGSGSSTAFQLYKVSNKVIAFVYASGNVSVGSTADCPLNQWFHVAMVRDGTNLRLYINGIEANSPAGLSTNSLVDSADPVSVGRSGSYNASYFQGYVNNFSVIKGTCLYPNGTTFTPPSSPLSTSTSGQSVLLCTANRFIDTNTATTAKTVTVSGPSIQPFSPFAPSAAYSASVNGGSGYFDGTGDYLTVSSSYNSISGTGDYTFSGWIYTGQDWSSQDRTLFIGGSSHPTYPFSVFLYNGYLIIGDSANFGSPWYSTRNSIGSYSNPMKLNQWNYIHIYRESGTLYIYANGLLQFSTSQANSIASKVADVTIAYWSAGSQYAFNGYISDLKTLNIANTTITVPTSPATSDANTSLLLNFTNAGIFDNTAKNNLETVGNAQVDTSVVKYGQGSMRFDGSGDWLIQNPIQTVAANENFTFECWINMNNNSTLGAWFSGVAVICYCVSADDVFASSSTDTASGYTTQITSSTTYSSGTWYHYALVRNGTGSNNITLYIDGVSVGTVTSNIALDFQYIGVQKNATSRAFSGYLDDIRLTRGVARYTTTFTPPGGPFLNK